MKTLWLMLALTLAAPAFAAEDFDSGQKAAQAHNPAGLICTLSLPNGQMQFRQGEAIPLTVSFTSDKARAYQLRRWSFGRMETLHVSPSEGTADPMADVPPQRGYFYSGPLPPGPVPITDKPITVPVIVNEWLRFDRPGLYRIYVTSARILNGAAKSGPFFDSGQASTVSSNSVQFQIVPADPAWAHTLAVTALAEVQKGYQGPMTIPDPFAALRYLGTPESAQALLSIMAADQFPNSSESKGGECRLGLIGYPNRAWLIGEMERDLTAPEYTVTQPFLETLAEIAAYQQKLKNNGPLLRTYWRQAAAAIPRKTDAARPMTLHTLLEKAWFDPAVGKDRDVQAYLPFLTQQMALDFDRLPPLPQSYLLGDNWTWFRSPALLPALRRLWAAASLAENASDFEPHNVALNNLILRRLYDLSHREGRALILKEAAASRPRVEMDALGILPDATLPGLDKTLAGRLTANQNTDQNADLTCQLVARYATGAVLPQTQAYYAREQDASTQASLLAYFLRVRPTYGRRILHQEFLLWLGRGHMETLIGEVADVQYSPVLEQEAVACLRSPDPGVVADAARTLGRYGSPKTEAALWARLRLPEANNGSRAVVEEGLTEALATGRGWYAGPARLKQIRALCITKSGLQAWDQILQQTSVGKVHVYYEIGGGYWSVDHYTGQGWTPFLLKLAQFPRGTQFSWQDAGFGSEQERLYAHAQVFTRTHQQIMIRERPVPLPG